MGIWAGERTCRREPGGILHASRLREGWTRETQGGGSVR